MKTDYKTMANDARKKVLELIYKAQTSHIGSNFSCIDIMTVLFERLDFNKDKFILSAGWKAASLYYFLWKRGRITESELNSYCQPGSKFIGLAESIIPEISFAGGSMGYGLPAGVGFALSKKLKGEDGKVYVLVSDGEMQCGTTWEAALIACQYGLSNLVIICDVNHFQAMGDTRNILDLELLFNKFITFGWATQVIDGHNYKEIDDALSFESNRNNQSMFIEALTVKGKGVSFMENNNLWHYSYINKETLDKALEELSGRNN